MWHNIRVGELGGAFFLKKNQSILLLTLTTLAIISLFFSVYLTRVFSHQRAREAEIVRKKEEKQKLAAEKEARKPYDEKMNDKISQKEFKNRLQIPLILQTVEPWKNEFYGEEGSDPIKNTIEINGCAITALAMVGSYLDKKEETPLDVLKWSGNRYYDQKEGTVWQIFNDYAAAKKFEFEDLGDQISEAKKHLLKGHPVVVSVKPGYFTEIGHVMVLSGYDEKNNTFWVNNPSDSVKKKHTTRAFKESEIQSEALRYWAIYK
ncbi:C39 family peptidase [Vagococcus hydrophili]|uniref:Peptidase C39 family protein n=1 Tax=Vagococcus hydrophili TaxID=2714947 RepID=A0A6G8AS93_9ENTE|nr:C39 family peptidase [Vagococcus hydrophili]QIL47948.1 peptidase C39 family protein [Vagococcus hydrophili]